MGERGNVCVIDDKKKVYLYTHWRAHELPTVVQSALAKKWRWDDGSYLARIIFDMMIGKEQGKETGFGISTTPADDAWRVVEVNCDDQTVRVINHGKEKLAMSFKDYITCDYVESLDD